MRQLLERQQLFFSERAELDMALSHLPCWPQEATLAERAVSLGYIEPKAPFPGEVLLVAVSSPVGVRSSLWKLSRARDGHPPFIGIARDSLGLAEQIASRVLPVIFSLEPLKRQGGWRVDFVAKRGDGIDQTLDGGSFGLSMLLAVASLLLEQPVPAELVASAAIDPDGGVHPVQGLREKIEALRDMALGVRRLLVAAEQADEARALAKELGATLQVIPVINAREALDAAFGDIEQTVRERLKGNPDAVVREAARIFALSLRNEEGIIEWRGVERAAELLLELLPQEHPVRFQAFFARQVARRHQGKPGDLAPASDAESLAMYRPDRARYQAHVVQAAGDVAAADRSALLQQVRSSLPAARDCHTDELEVLGAVGRVLSTLRRYEEASHLLADVVGAWEAIGRFSDAARPLCEWIRVLGVRGDSQRLETALSTADRFLTGQADPASRAFVRFACGRALAQVGRREAAGQHLKDGAAAWEVAPNHLRLSRLRWLAAVEEGDATRSVLGRQELSIETLLWRLDECLVEGGQVEELLAAIVELEPELCGAFIDGALSPLEQANRLAREYPY